MFSVRSLVRTFSRPVSALILLCVCCVFVISQYTSVKYISVTSKSTFTLMDAPRKQNDERLLSRSGISTDQLRLDSSRETSPNWTYVCANNACVRREVNEAEDSQSLDVCWLTCGSHGAVWPFPKYEKRGPETRRFLPANIQLSEILAGSEEVKQLMLDAFRIKQNHFENFPGLNLTSSRAWFAFPWSFGSKVLDKTVIKVSISSNSTEEILTLTTDESYEISIEENISSESWINLSVIISAKTFFGFRHGLETFSQLVALDKSGECLQILKSYHTKDEPKFPFRGILIDSARNFIPLNFLRRIIDGMSYNKLNILHLHLSDSNAFTFYSRRVPQMTQYGALSEKHIYFPDELKELVKYARIRGVKIIPELDAPSHAGNGWQFGKKLGMGDLAFYINTYNNAWKQYCGQPPCGILNPVNIHVYDVLENLYNDMLEVFDKDLFHMGGDEVNTDSWVKQPELNSWMMKNKTFGISLWKFFQSQAFDRLRKHSEKVTAILWTSTLTEGELEWDFLNSSDYIIQVWDSSNSRMIDKLLTKGFRLIISYVDKFYLDWGEGTWLGRQHDWSFHNWQLFYDTKVDLKYAKRKNQILGAEAPLWSEKTGPWQVEVKLWPRAAALAENLWSNPTRRNDEVYSRLNYHNYRMQNLGIPTGQLQPESCLHFNGHCSNPVDVI